MVGGTSFHRVILKASFGRNEQKQQQQQNQNRLRREDQNLKTLRQVQVSLDNADKVIESGPFIRALCEGWGF